ncbi:hypothetical protein JL720_4602 [Aureococcus anophagefferens]|nr:hypothetical protein JL720_4602 [Aureococcus anophagefferens]
MGFGSASPAEAAARLAALQVAAAAEDLAAADADAAALFGAGDLDAGDATLVTEPLVQNAAKKPAARTGLKAPESVVCYLGPTNSGKTWRADFLASRGDGCYAGPLRALAWEVRESMVERVAEKWGKIAPGVGLWTGEESEDADASVLCCTAEVAPADGDVLVLDEVHCRSSVLALAAAAQAAGARASVIFGKLPPEARRSQLEAATARRRHRRGPRGRGDAPGHCWVYGKFNAKAALVKKAVAVANGDGAADGSGGLDLDRAVLSPDLGALVDVCGGEASILHLPNAIALWREELAKDFEADDSAFPTWVKGGDFADLTARLRKLASPELVPRRAESAEARRPLAPRAAAHRRAQLRRDRRGRVPAGDGARARTSTSSTAKLEDEVQRLGDLLIAARRFPGILPPGILAAARGTEDGDPYDDALEAAEALYLEGSKRVGTQVQRCIDNARKCVDCGRNKSANAKPSDARCRSCFLAKMRDEQEQRRASDAASMPATPSTPGRPVVLDLRRTPYTPMGTPIPRRRRPRQGGRGLHDVNARTLNRGKGGGKGKPENKPGQ